MSSDARHKRLAFLLTPLDTLFCRDGRPFGAGSAASGGLPQPQTVAGAFRTRVLRALQVNPATVPMSEWRPLVMGMRFRGPWLARPGANETYEPLLPAPADIVRPTKERGNSLTRLRIPETPPAGWRARPMLPPRPLWLESRDTRVEPFRGLLTLKGMRSYLSGNVPASDDTMQESSLPELYEHEPRVGIGIDADQLTAAQSQIYSTRMLRLKAPTKLYVEIDVPVGCHDDAAEAFPDSGSWTMPLGGEGKLVSVTPFPPITWPGSTVDRNDSLLVLTTPGLFPAQPFSVPSAIPGWSLQSAAVPGYVPVSGWDLKQRCPKPTRNFVVPGSVYCFEKRDLGASPLPDQLGITGDTIAGHGLVVEQGYGLCLKGVWFHG